MDGHFRVITNTAAVRCGVFSDGSAVHRKRTAVIDTAAILDRDVSADQASVQMEGAEVLNTAAPCASLVTRYRAAAHFKNASSADIDAAAVFTRLVLGNGATVHSHRSVLDEHRAAA